MNLRWNISRRVIDFRRVAAAGLVCLSPVWVSPSSAEISISPDLPATFQSNVAVPVASWSAVEIGDFKPGQKVQANVSFSGGLGDMSAAVVDEAGLNFFKQGLPSRALIGDRKTSPISIGGTTWGYGKYFLLLDNRQSVLLGRAVNYRVDFVDQMDAAGQKQLKDTFEQVYSVLKTDLDFPDFNIRVAPCGQSNAFSSPDITLCIELIIELVRKQRQNALVGIFMHELGHSLLNLWGLAGYDNEDVADEFAAALLLSDKSDSAGRVLSDMITWFSEQDSKRQASAILAVGDRHSPSIQRVRNLQRIAENPAPVVARWNNVIYPHMTNEALTKLVTRSGPGDDVALAERILASRASTHATAKTP